MTSLREWFQSVTGHRFVPLFDADETLIVRTKLMGNSEKQILKRSPAMENAVISCIEQGLSTPEWEGMMYVMGWGMGSTFRPLYVGKAERRGVKHGVSGNIANIRKNSGKFARWGDGLDYHIGDLSHAMFEFEAYRKPMKKYKRWASTLFRSVSPPMLTETVNLYLAPWCADSTGPSGLSVSLPDGEKEVIALASVEFADSLLNVDGV